MTPKRQRDRRRIVMFLTVLAALYICAAAVSDFVVARSGTDGPFQKLLAHRGKEVDWIVIGTSHALPLAFGGIPERLRDETGKDMMILAEVGAGPLYSLFVARQALHDLAPRNVLYVIDDFAFQSAEWNTARVADRTLLRRTPTRLSTMGFLGQLVVEDGVDPRAMADYLTAFSKLNPPTLFPSSGWEGAQAFDRRYRPSRHSIDSRVEYLYPDGMNPDEAERGLRWLEAMVSESRAVGAEVSIVRLPMPDVFRSALPDASAFHERLGQKLDELNVQFLDLADVLGGPEYYFDSDHLNRSGVDQVYREHLSRLFIGE